MLSLSTASMACAGWLLTVLPACLSVCPLHGAGKEWVGGWIFHPDGSRELVSGGPQQHLATLARDVLICKARGGG